MNKVRTEKLDQKQSKKGLTKENIVNLMKGLPNSDYRVPEELKPKVKSS